MPNLSTEEAVQGLSAHWGMDMALAQSLAHVTDGNLAQALRMARAGENQPDLDRFSAWMRACWSRDGRAMVEGSEAFASLGREGQKRFLHYALHLGESKHCGPLRGGVGALDPTRTGFLQKFSKFIHHDNVLDLRRRLKMPTATSQVTSMANWSSSI